MPEGLSRRASSGTDELRMPGVRLYREIHVALAADKEGHALMQLGGHDVEHPVRAVARPSSVLVADEREGFAPAKNPRVPVGVVPLHREPDEPPARMLRRQSATTRAA